MLLLMLRYMLMLADTLLYAIAFQYQPYIMLLLLAFTPSAIAITIDMPPRDTRRIRCAGQRHHTLPQQHVARRHMSPHNTRIRHYAFMLIFAAAMLILPPRCLHTLLLPPLSLDAAIAAKIRCFRWLFATLPCCRAFSRFLRRHAFAAFDDGLLLRPPLLMIRFSLLR